MKFFANDLAHGIQERLLVGIGDQSVIDQSLIAAPTKLFDNSAEIVEHCVIKPNGYLCLAGFKGNYGTSLGVRQSDGRQEEHGHRNHMRAINAIYHAGDIAKAVASGRLKSGVMYECVKARVPFVLAVSIIMTWSSI